ncbi:hypothetical protein NSB25_24460 [Acetatifactor muris]|uniref:Uncharacterized protein n=1 Tax=Acetatifactor muris TaxID=879566 RepID=A0A2K4ZPH3_9FIRM|nr:hypothetical protein [Acetatifactor muris]MCR2050400.1 hypothetical protein [Acetatifactor muris]SOY32369.1 hypothetical protein AMURIS_05127 [Acetatifactor muris]
MRIGTDMAAVRTAGGRATAAAVGRRFEETASSENITFGSSLLAMGDGRPEEERDSESGEESAAVDTTDAQKIYQAVAAGKPNPFGVAREGAKVPYGHLAKDGVIIYKGVCFVCDEETNSICLGDMTDKKKVLNIPLSGGGHLKVNRDSIGLLSKAVGMFSPEDLNLIMRAIAEDTKIQSVQKEIEDEEASIGNHLGNDAQAEDSGRDRASE